LVQFTKLRLSGFKSFVDPTDVFIEGGVTGIVGPNGCGKSNLVEALRWAMGENSAKRMRGSEMDDVIFAGSASRPARNFADVTLALDNSDRTAPAMFNEFDQLEVVRQITRGQGSTYRVNGKEVRARDVQLLFADAASGAHSPALVSQGRIGAIVNAKPTDRRALLEEAAGIMGLHSRRHEAELRLRAAETNLERLDDVISTLETQHQGLKKQARQATRYRNINDQVRKLEAIILHLEAEAARATLAEAQEALREAERLVAEQTEAAAATATQQSEAAAQLPDLRQEEAEAAAALQRLLVDRDNLRRDEERAAAELEQAEQRRAQFEGDKQRAETNATDAREALARLEEERERLSREAEGESDARETVDARLREATEAVTAREHELSELTQRVATDEARAGSLEKRIRELMQRQERLRAQLEDNRRQKGDVQAETAQDEELQATAAQLSLAEATLESSLTAAEQAAAKLTELQESEAKARSALQEATSKRAKLEAEAQALAAVLQVGEPDIWPPLVDSVSVNTGYETALGAALGDDLSASSDEAAPVHWETLPPFTAPAALPAGATPLNSLVKAPEALARRLSQIGVVADVASGTRLQKDLAPGQRLVTREGALWRWDGFTAKADAPTAAAVRLEQRNRLTELTEEVATAIAESESAETRNLRAKAAAEEAAATDKATRSQVEQSFAEVDRLRRRETGLTQKAADARSRLTALEETEQRLKSDLDEAEQELTASRQEAADLPSLDSERERIQEIRTLLAEQRTEQAERRSDLDRVIRESEARGQRLLAINTEEASWTRRVTETQRHMVELDERLGGLAEDIVRLKAVPLQLTERRERLAELVEAAESERKKAADNLATAETRLAEADRNLKQSETALASKRENRVRSEAAVTQGEQSLEVVKDKVRDKLNCSMSQVLEVAEVPPGSDLPPREDAETKLARLLRERENMGPVNLRAEAEAQELDQQITGLQNERSDLIAAIARLRQGISSLNKEGRERLLEAFEKVNSHFSELFVRLFGGGRAHLKLTESEDPLDAGLEIMASPPGKRLQTLSLLSGGEQALTALSLLFAVFLTNPAPVCVLDEVDAPLDDANVDRFCTLIDELTRSSSTRFLVITHHRMTMARVDRLFGVTMGERGVSQLVSVDLETAEELRKTA